MNHFGVKAGLKVFAVLSVGYIEKSLRDTETGHTVGLRTQYRTHGPGAVPNPNNIYIFFFILIEDVELIAGYAPE